MAELSPPPVTMDASVGDNRAPLVLVAGLSTTALALAGVFALDRDGTNIMGWYADFVLPVGALLVGLAASSGYGIAGWKLHCKITGGLLWTVVALTVAAYLAAQYLEYRLVAPPIGFFSYFDSMTRSFRWEDSSASSSLGELGYGLRALELAGFVGGGLVGPAILRSKPYCERCRRYKDAPLVAIVLAGVDDDTLRHARGLLDAIFSAARTDSFDAVAAQIAEHGPLSRRKLAERRSAYIGVKLEHCPRCLDGALAAELTTTNRRKRSHVTKIGRAPLAPSVVGEFVKRKAA